MLSELLFASVQTKREIRPDRMQGLSGSQLFPCAYRLYQVHMGKPMEEELEPQQVYNMQDGWDQEAQTIRRLKDGPGIEIFNRQKRVLIGKSKIPGTIDGEVRVRDKLYGWEHKAWSTRAFSDFVHFGIDKFPQQKAQANAYFLSEGLDEFIFHVKCKENNDYADRVYPIDREFIEPIIEWADKIRLDGWMPEPVLCKWCTQCGYDCFSEKILDFSSLGEAKAPEIAEKWRQGTQLKRLGEMMVDDARAYFIGDKDKRGLVGDKDILTVEGLKIAKIPQRRWDINRQSIIREFGVDGFLKVATEKIIDTYRITDMEE